MHESSYSRRHQLLGLIVVLVEIAGALGLENEEHVIAASQASAPTTLQSGPG